MTIHGTAVHIGKGGKIDKGPAELMSKTENGAHAHQHDTKAHAHGEAAQGKGAKHPDTKAHQEAEKHHIEAAGHFKSADYHAGAGNLKAARAEHEAGHASAEKARLAGVAASKNEPSDTGAFEKPSAHKALHADADDDVKGSEKHEAEHKRLLGEYGKSKNKWEREAVNQQIAKNAEEGSKAQAQTKHHKALQASAHAKNTDNPEDHKAARSAIDAAREAHERSGGEGSQGKIKELDTMRKPHHSAVQKAEKEAKKNKPAGNVNYDDAIKNVASSSASPEHKKVAIEALQAAQKKAGGKKQYDPMPPEKHEEQRTHHEQQAKAALKRGDSTSFNAHNEAADAHAKAARHASDATSYSKTSPELQKKHAEASQAAQEASEHAKQAGGGKPSGVDHHEAEMERHNTAAKEAQQNGNGEAARAHAHAYRAHMAAVSSHGSSGYDQDRAFAGIASKKADEASKKSSAPGHLTHKHSQASGTSGIAKIAARHAKDIADQDPKSKK